MTLQELYDRLSQIPEADRRTLTVYASELDAEGHVTWNARVVAVVEQSSANVVLGYQRDATGWAP